MLKSIAMGVALTLSTTVAAEEFIVDRQMHCAEDPSVAASIIEESGFAPFVSYAERMTLVHSEQGPIPVDGETIILLNDQNHVLSFWVVDDGSFYCMNTVGQYFEFMGQGI